MHPILFGLTGWWELCGGHVTLGTLVALLIARVLHEIYDSLLLSIITYYFVCVVFWAVCDWVWGPYPICSSVYEWCHY